MLELEIIFELQNLYSLRFIESEICLQLFETLSTKLKLSTENGLQFLYSHHF